jgi:hypothetical protein
MTVNSFCAQKPEYLETKTTWNLEGSNIDSVLGIFKERELRSCAILKHNLDQNMNLKCYKIV